MNKTVKCLIGFAVSCTVAFCVITLLPTHNEADIYDGVVRLHVIANSDGEQDQSLKLSVRDAVLDAVSEYSMANKAEAEKSIEERKEEIAEISEKTLRSLGCSDKVRVEFGKEKYPVRFYDSFALPAGEYTSLKVIIGSGEGHNWWCVLYPPMCTASCEAECEDEFISAGFTGEEYRLIQKNSGVKYKVRFRLLEILSDTFGFEY